MRATRILLLGTSGSGKTTLARQIAARLQLPHVELDSIRHRENWSEMPDGEFREVVAGIVAGDCWVIDGNYGVVRDITIGRATHVVWLDPSKHVVMAQVIWRSLTRAISKKPLWNGNREQFSHWIRPTHPIRFAWSTHADRRRRLGELVTEKWVRLRTRRESRAWLAALQFPRE